ncbi:ZIP family metal transporter [bacterium]|nr:ZIP family metal transporter [bacterium]
MEEWHPVVQAFVATLFTWGVTALGAALVFVRKDLGTRFLDTSLGFAGGVMLAASVWSLLLPALALSHQPRWLPVSIGFLAGGLALRLVDHLLPHLHSNLSTPEGLPTHWSRSVLLVLAIALHNIPEGLAVGVAFGAAALHQGTLNGAIALAVGIGLQNFPEGMAVAFPLRREGLSARKCFYWGQLSGAVEPLAGMLGAALVLAMQPILPYALAFAAGAMVFVVVEEVIPASQSNQHHDLATLGLMLGFTTMMALDVALSP